VSQIRGGAIAGSTLGGAPARGQEVHASVAPASSGNTSSVSVTFHRDPSDANFSQAKVYVSGYQGNKSRILVAASDSGPITFVLNNSGASISLIVQASGNFGDAPIDSSPATGVRLPQSDAGGFGTGTNTGLTLTGTTGALVKKSGTSSLTTTDLSGDVTTNSTPAATVVKIQGVPVSNFPPNISDTLRYDGTQWAIMAGDPRVIGFFGDGQDSIGVYVDAQQPVTSGSKIAVAATATESMGIKHASAASASVNSTALAEHGMGASAGKFTFGTCYRFTSRVMPLNNTNARYWIGLGKSAPQFGSPTYASNTPNTALVGFRWTAGTDTNWQAYCGVSSGSNTIVDIGVAPSFTASTLFEIINVGGTSTNYKFLLNGSLDASISSTLPTASENFGQLLFCADNLNTANVCSATFFWSTLMLN